MKVLGTIVAMVAVIATPASANEFVDYFDHGRSELSPQGYTMVRWVVQYAQSGHPTRVIIVGHMDTAEAAEFSDELSRRRAQTVASELVMLGIDPTLIEIEGRGASALARPTPPNTSEPLNRRVTVGINF